MAESLWLEEARILVEEPGQEQELEQELVGSVHAPGMHRPIVEDISSEEEEPVEEEEEEEKHVFCMTSEIPCFSIATAAQTADEKEGSDLECSSPCPPPQSPPIYSPDTSEEFCDTPSTFSDL